MAGTLENIYAVRKTNGACQNNVCLYQLPRSKLAWFVTALRLSSGGAGFGIITRYDWRVDDRPADIDRRDVVGRSGEPSDDTEKRIHGRSSLESVQALIGQTTNWKVWHAGSRKP